MHGYQHAGGFRGDFLKPYLLLALVGCVLLLPLDCWSLESNEILVVANSNVPDSTRLAKYYMQRRRVPARNLIVLSLTDKEQCSREEYTRKVALPIRMYLGRRPRAAPRIKCIVTVYGVPLVVSDSGLGLRKKAKLLALKGEREGLLLLREDRKNGEQEPHKFLAEKIESIENQIIAIEKTTMTAALDSELALVLEKKYPLSGWIPNPNFLGYQNNKPKDGPKAALLVARLDGPSASTVRRIIDDSLTAEAKGLQGIAYFDARWPESRDKELVGYAYYDRSIHEAGKVIKKNHVMPVVLDEKEQLFQRDQCPNAALYCGWYSLGNYIDSFRWVPGSVGYHIASRECETLRKHTSNVWCKVMLEKGIAATIGPVGEPYVQAFPPPEVFFGLLVDGRFTLAECFALSNPFLSWKMVLIGDPLYRPFKQVSRR